MAQARDSMVNRALNIINEISALADDFNLTTVQKSEVRSVLIDYLPRVALKASSMVNNRKDLILNTSGVNLFDETYVNTIAEKQGQLITQVIILKEQMKKEIRAVLTEEQKGFVDELIAAIIQYRLLHTS